MAFDPADATDYNQDAFTADAVREEAANESGLELQRKAEARRAGVKHARFIGYADVLAIYNERSDTEPLADRRARESATDAGQQSFTRAAEYTGNSVETETQYPDDGGWGDDFADPGPAEGDPDYVAPDTEG